MCRLLIDYSDSSFSDCCHAQKASSRSNFLLPTTRPRRTVSEGSQLQYQKVLCLSIHKNANLRSMGGLERRIGTTLRWKTLQQQIIVVAAEVVRLNAGSINARGILGAGREGGKWSC